ncbi:uncharacterized protein GGS22DRAFT_57682 [Annulohypoxylon maeteangense]|uniref:uncharacterized protein n=1 Tax=Annulohypoxylon maeteangense TaxID=1927788 RepID=UPI00200737D4|nr:uncharacterized protein GGS22DRAFT_57682 [Annulohypoxylon maeteangense]KAI0881412.1 hypothetical protein GGS22DRAFT_57682 [Annulohypoxylon maeteangense]
MWLLENEDEALDGKRLWLRPGKRYLFGRTVAEPGQLAIKGEGAERVSRKHVTIQVDEVAEGDGEIVSRRSRVTVEDLGSKGGTWINNEKVKGEKRILSQDVNVLQMGSFTSKFRITWFPVVLSFSFTAKEIQANPLSKLREDLEQLDIKFLADYDPATTHVVSKKRNVPKTLQALVNGRYLVTSKFYDTIITAATPEDVGDGVVTSALEGDFDANWPDAIQFLPPPGDEVMPRPVEAFAPDPNRAEIFHGYTFIFYNKKQYDNLLGPIANGGGKALLHEAVEEKTNIDDFIRYAKEIAGEKGLGEFEDGSEGKGVVVVRWIPDPPMEWFNNFYRSISQRLDQRLIEQKEFLDAILNNDASSLRRPLQADTSTRTSRAEQPPPTAQYVMEIDEHEPSAQQQKPPPRRRARGPVKSRFKGFDVDLDDDDFPDAAPAIIAPPTANVESSQEGLFVSQDAAPEEPEEPTPANRQSQRKRRAPVPPESQDTIDSFAPTAAQVKRRRIAAGEDPLPRQTTPVAPVMESQIPKAKTPKIKKEIDVLDLARQHREEAEARAKAEREELAMVPEDLDLAEIRRLHIEEPIEVRQIPAVRTREQDIADGRWDPAWNGRKNFKKFKQRRGPSGRAPQKIIVALEEVKTKGFGIGDDYWLEDESQQRKRKKQSQTHSESQSTGEKENTNRRSKELERQKKLPTAILPAVDSSDDEIREDHDMDDEEDVVKAPASRARTTRTTRGSQTTSQSTSAKTQPSRTSKRPAPPAKEHPAKRSRLGFIAGSDDESDDGLRFRFGKR